MHPQNQRSSSSLEFHRGTIQAFLRKYSNCFLKLQSFLETGSIKTNIQTKNSRACSETRGARAYTQLGRSQMAKITCTSRVCLREWLNPYTHTTSLLFFSGRESNLQDCIMRRKEVAKSRHSCRTGFSKNENIPWRTSNKESIRSWISGHFNPVLDSEKASHTTQILEIPLRIFQLVHASCSSKYD